MSERVAESDRSGLDDGPERGSASAGERDQGFCRTYPAVAESVATIRAAVAHFATEVGAAPSAVDAATLAVSEAATNVVLHAYAGAAEPGLIHVEAAHTAGELRVTVADTGTGLRAGDARPGLGLGLASIRQLADHVELLQGGSNGLRVVMHFALPAGTPRPGRD